MTGEGNEVKYFDLTPFAGFFALGQTNTIAIMLQNTWTSDFDNVAFDIALQGIPAAAPTIAQFISMVANPDGTDSLAFGGPPDGSWALESFDSTGMWRSVQTVTFDSSGTAVVTDSGQNGRPVPSAISSRLYRLRSL